MSSIPSFGNMRRPFGRAPDQAGLAYWAGVAATLGLGGLSAAFANSQEFFNLYGVNATTPTTTLLVEALYQNILGHPETRRASLIGRRRI